MNTNDKDKDLEYELPEEQFGEELGPEFQGEAPKPPKKPSLWKRLPKKKILIGIIVLVMVVLVYQFLSRQEEKALQPPEAALQPAKPAPAKPAAPVMAKAQIPSPAPTPSETQKAEALLQEKMTTSQGTKELQTEVQGVKESVQGLQDNLSSLVSSIETLSNQVKALKTVQPQVVQQPIIQLPVVTKMRALVPPRPIYYLRAVTAGREAIRTSSGEVGSIKVDRAWLIDPAGESFSVKVGDQVRGYGCVSTINADEGWVSFTSGAVIKYAPKDT